MNRSYGKIVKFFAAGWLIAVLLWIGLRTPGLIATDDPNYDWKNTIPIIPPFVLIAGLLYGGIAYWVEKRLYGTVSLFKLTASIFSLQSIATTGLMLLGIYMYRAVSPETTVSVQEAFFSPTGITFILYSFFINIGIIFFRQASLMIGGRRLNKILSGQFYTPQKEYVVFLFMDLKSSVYTAQKLKAETYSRFIQECFEDVTAVEPFGAQVYQYIGDEVVLCWYPNDGDNLDECVYAWQAFTMRIKERMEYYTNEFGMVPVFRGGLHAGHVITAEIGVYRRDIAHHGHTINKAARVQEYGKHMEKPLTITHAVYKQLSADLQQACIAYGNKELRNIQEPEMLYGL